MAGLTKETQVVPYFYNGTLENPTKSKQAGRPIFDDIEMVEVRLAGDRNFAPHFPAHSMWERQDGEEITYAMRWPEQYAAFKNENVQTASGTPLEELTFLTAARRSELKALKIYTAEALAGLEGPNLKVLAGEGYSLKEQAQAYLDSARSTASVTGLAAQNAELAQRIAMLEAQLANVQTGPSIEDSDPYQGLDDNELKIKIENLTGSRPRGNPSRATLIGILNDLANTPAAEAA